MMKVMKMSVKMIKGVRGLKIARCMHCVYSDYDPIEDKNSRFIFCRLEWVHVFRTAKVCEHFKER